MQNVIELNIDRFPQSESPWSTEWYVDLKGPDGETMRIPGYFDGTKYKFRAAPFNRGNWTYNVFHGDALVDQGEVTFAPADDPLKGGLCIDADNPRRFAFPDGSPCFLSSYEANWLFALEAAHPGEGRVADFLRRIREYGFNCVLMNLYAHDTSWATGKSEERDYGPPALSPWEGGNDAPDFSRPSTDFWLMMDRVVEQFQQSGMFLHLYFKVYNKMVAWPAAGSAEEELYFRHTVARYQACSCIIWDFAKETYYEPDKALIERRMRQIGEWDAHRRLLTVHDDLEIYSSPAADKYLDFQTVQQHHDFHTSVLMEASRHEWPYVNVEFGYECGPGGLSDVTHNLGQTPQELVRRAWIVAMSGGYPAYYYVYTAWDIIHEDAVPTGYRFFQILSAFYNGIDFASFRPAPEMLLWRSSFAMAKGNPGQPEEFICFVDWHILVPSRLSPDDFDGEWLNVYSGERRRMDETSYQRCADSEEYTIYTIPFNAPHAVLHLRRRQE